MAKIVKKPAMKKAKAGSSLGMKSVKAGYDKNPGVTRADFVSIGKGKAKTGKTVKKAFLGNILGAATGLLGGGAGGGLLGGLLGGGAKGGAGGAGGGMSKISKMFGGSMKKGGKVAKKAKTGTIVKKAENGVKTKPKPKPKLLTVSRTRQVADSLDYEGDMKAQAAQNRTIGTYVKDYKDAKGYDKIAQELNQSSIKDRSNASRYRKLADQAEKKKKAKTGASVKKCRYGCK